jgi:hypothetical protein
MEMGRINYFKFNQDAIRAELYSGVRDAVLKNDFTDPKSIGKRTILPASFTGGPRHMAKL